MTTTTPSGYTKKVRKKKKGPDSKKLAPIVLRRRRVYELYFDPGGHSQDEIAKILKIGQATISRDVREIVEAIDNEIKEHGALMRTRQYMRLEALRRQAEKDYEKSREAKRVSKIERTLDAAGQLRSTKQTQLKEEDGESGDPKYLELQLKVMQEQGKVMGFNAPEKKALTDADGKPLDPSNALAFDPDNPLRVVLIGNGPGRPESS